MRRSIFFNRTGSGLTVFLVILAILLVVGAAFLFTMNNHEPVTVHNNAPRAPKPDVKISETNKYPERSWDMFVSSISKRCSKEPNCSLDYKAFHEYNGQSFGITVLAWKDSEYVVELYRYDPKRMGWTESPRSVTEGFEYVDTSAASKKWGVPQDVLKKWLKEAEDFMTKKYNNGGN